MLFGAVWAFIPAYLQAKRGSHIVITTIMFNFIAASLMVYLINNRFRPVGRMAVESRGIAGAWMPSFREIGLRLLALRFPLRRSISPFSSPSSRPIVVWYLLWRTRLGYEIRAVGANTEAAVYAGIKPDRIIIIAMADFRRARGAHGGERSAWACSIAWCWSLPVAPALSASPWRSWAAPIPWASCFPPCCSACSTRAARNCPLPSPVITRDMIVVIQGLVILFMGALEYAFRPALARNFITAED